MRTLTTDIRQRLARWRSLLRLQDWDIDLETMPATWEKSGDIRIDAHTRCAVLQINRRPRCDNLDELVVHELVHLKLWGLDQMIEELLGALYGGAADAAGKTWAHGRFMDVLEPTVEDLTKAFLAASGSRECTSFDRARAAATSCRCGPGDLSKKRRTPSDGRGGHP